MSPTPADAAPPAPLNQGHLSDRKAQKATPGGWPCYLRAWNLEQAQRRRGLRDGGRAVVDETTQDVVDEELDLFDEGHGWLLSSKWRRRLVDGGRYARTQQRSYTGPQRYITVTQPQLEDLRL